jgi:Predicted AAA-ATPase/PD-(D/E)XK nuclease superfamily
MALIGYAEADFYSLITKGHYYVDRTSFIARLESLGNRNLLFSRPRRFGKSLWISTLEHYYDVRFKDEFEMLFGNFYIGKNPTPNRNNYIVLRIQFSGIDVATNESAYSGYLKNVKSGVKECMIKHPTYFSKEDIAEMNALLSPENVIQEFFTLCRAKRIPHKLYTLIDEYDHFANELFSLDIERFQNIVSRTGFVRKTYEILKNGMGEGVVERNFMTGVAPLTLDAMTSGFNTITHLTLRPEFHSLMGFTKQEVETIMQAIGAPEQKLPTIMEDLTEWYNGYLFHHKAKERLYNSDMVMYFAEQYERSKAYPEKMLDTNIASDYRKVRKVFVTNAEDTTYVPLLKSLTNDGWVSAGITDIFNFEKPFEESDIISLLFYMGWLTIERMDEGEYVFRMPNRVIQELYYDYFVVIIEEESQLNRTHGQIRKSLVELAKNNNLHPFLDIIKALIDKQLSLRDAQKFDEKHLKMLLIPYLSLSLTHYVVSEPEWENKYADLLLLKRPNIETRYNFIWELKYVKKSDKNKKDPNTGEKHIDKITREARAQLNTYIATENAQRIANLKAWVLILVGRDWHLVEEMVVVR